ncbi:hypothetical protein EDC01DRAFT_707249 [Geopyxis carbonaria]|nr:hypothetical protein EDC01DRAFT_707249 [Geopyxis carbonaria]
MSVPSGSDEVSSVDENLPRGTPTPPPENQIQDTIHGRTVPKTTEQTVAGQCTVPSEIGDQIREFLINHIKTARPGLSRFYKDLDDNPALEAAIPRAEAMVRRMVSKKCSLEEALSMSPISLYDVVMLLGLGSWNVNSAKLTKRQITLEETLVAVTDIVQRACEAKSIALRFLNRPDLWDKINTRKVCNIVRNKVVWEGTTPIGTMLKRRILDEFVKEDMERPVLVIIVTDGMIEGEPEGLLRKVIHKQALELQHMTAVSYQFATIGDDPGAKSLMKSLDDDKELKHLIDCMCKFQPAKEG